MWPLPLSSCVLVSSLSHRSCLHGQWEDETNMGCIRLQSYSFHFFFFLPLPLLPPPFSLLSLHLPHFHLFSSFFSFSFLLGLLPVLWLFYESFHPSVSLSISLTSVSQFHYPHLLSVNFLSPSLSLFLSPLSSLPS